MKVEIKEDFRWITISEAAAAVRMGAPIYRDFGGVGRVWTPQEFLEFVATGSAGPQEMCGLAIKEESRVLLDCSMEEAERVMAVLGICSAGGPTSDMYWEMVQSGVEKTYKATYVEHSIKVEKING